METKRNLISVILAAAILLLTALPGAASISPTELTATLRPCQSITEIKEVHVEEIPPKVDVVFAFDLTGSMSGIINTAKAKAADIIAELNAATGVDIQYAVMSYMDYNGSYNSCGYSASYGGGPDYPYRLDQSITSDSAAVVAAINSLSLGWGNDGPQDYTRIFYESYADSSVGWRPGAKRILVNFGDNVPHDCNLNEGVTGGIWTTGGDPGRDAVMGTTDDLDLQAVLAGMAANGVVLIECHTSSYANAYWDYWTGVTGGDVYITSSSTLVDDVVSAVLSELITPVVYGLHLEASTGFESWLASVLPPSHDEVEPCNTVKFTLTIHVPLGTEAGEYTFTISAVDENGVSYGDQKVTITVITEIEVPVDIKPTSCPNPLNVKSNGVLPVAIVGTEDFEVKGVDPGTVKLEGVSPLRCNYEDVCTPYYPFVGKETRFYCTEEGPDGFLDLTLKFDKQAVVQALPEVDDGDEIVLELTGELYDGTPIVGEDVVIILKKGKK